MEQKLVLPIVVIVVLVGGFFIGYYAATSGVTGKFSKGALSLDGRDAVSKAQYPEFFQAQAFTQFLRGQFVGATDESVIISQSGRELSIRKAGITSYFVDTAGSVAPASQGDLKPGEEVRVALSVDPETGRPQAFWCQR